VEQQRILIAGNGQAVRSDYHRVLGFLRDQLLSGELKVGDKLLPERELATLLGVGRPVLREALRALAMIGAVEIRHGIGTFVRSPDISTLGDFFAFIVVQQSSDTDDIMESRMAIEHHAARLACKRATQRDYDSLALALARISETIADPVEGAKADFGFHSAIVQASHSPTLITIYRTVSEFIVRSHVERRAQILEVEGIHEYLIDHHHLIFGALLERDAAEADRLLAQHFEIGADFNRRATLISYQARGTGGAAAVPPRHPKT